MALAVAVEAGRHIRQGSFGPTQTPMKEIWGGNEGGCCSVVICRVFLVIKHPLHFKKLEPPILRRVRVLLTEINDLSGELRQHDIFGDAVVVGGMTG